MYRVLYVDDEPGLLELGKVFLEMSGTLRIDTALSAADAIKKLENEAYDGIIADYQMPVMDGIAFLKILRKDNNGIPFILFTGRGREEVVIEALNSGADFYLQKGGDPVSQFVELEHKILLAIERKQTGAALIESRQRMTDIIDHLPDATFAIDLDGKVIAWNRAMEEMTGVHKEQILGTGDHSYALPFYGTRRPILLDLVLREDMETEKKYPNIIKKDNKLISEIYIPLLYGGKGAYLWFIASPLYDTHGNITGAIESIRDISDQKRQDHILITQLDLGLALQSIRGLNTTLKTCLRAAIEISGMDAGGIYLVDDLSGSVDLILSQNLDDEFVKSVSHYPAGSANAQMVMVGKPIYTHFNKTGIAHIPVQEREKLRAVAIIPVVSMGRVIACINISSHIFDEIPSNARVGLETIATQIGTAIERIRTDEALAQSEQKYRNVVEDQTEFICRFLPDGTHVFVNEAYCRYFGKTCREIIGTRFVPRVVDEDKQQVQQHFRQLTRQNPVATMEHRIIMPDGRIRWQQWSDRAIFNDLGNLIEYQSVGRDITDRKMADEELSAAYEQITATEEELREQYDELKKSGDALRESEENYRALFDEAADLIVIIDAHGTFLNLNRKFVEEGGYQKEEMIGKNVLTSGILTAPSAAKTAFHLSQIILGKKLPSFEIDGVAKDGTVIPYEVRATPITKNGKISAFQAILRNLTGRKEAEKEIRESRTRLEEIVHGSPIPQFVIDKNHQVISWNRALEEYSGVKAKDVIGTTDTWKAFYDKERPVLADLLVENKPEKIPEWYSGKYHPSKYVEGAYEATDFFPRMGKTGIWLYFTASALRDYDGNIVGAVETLEDITEQKKADEELQASYEQITASEEELRDQYDELKKNEDALRESEERYRTVFENTGTAMVILEEDTTISFANTQFERLTGYAREEIEGKKHWTEYVVPEDLEWMKEQHRARRESDKKALTQYEFSFISRSGEIHNIFLNIDMIPGTTKSVASLLDITERKKAEDALRESEQQLRMIANTVPGVLYQFYARSSGEMGMYYTSERSLELFGISTDPTTFFPRFTECVATEDREAFLTSIDKAVKTVGKWDYKGRFIKPTGEEIYFHGMSEPVRSGDELVFHGVLLDITAQEWAERALHASEEQYRSLVETTGTGYVIIDKDGRVITANQEYVRLTGRSTLAEIQGSAVTSWTAPYDLDRNTSEVANCIRNGKVRGLEIDYQKPDGTIQPVEINASVIQSDSGQTILTLCRDITRRRSAAKALEKEQEFTRLLLDTSPAFFVAIGANGRTLTMNQALIDALEYPADEIPGTDYLTIFVPEEDREMLAGVFRKIAGDGTVSVNENRIISKSGKVYLVEWHERLVKHEDKNLDFIVSVGIDITERKRAEEALRKSEENYRVIVENMEDMFYRTDKKGNLIMVSPSAARLAGYSSPEELFGLDTCIFYPDPGDRENFLAALRKTGSVTSYLLPFKRRDGTICAVMASSHYYYDKDGSVSGVEGILHDVTALHEAGNALCEANKKLNLFNSITRHDMLNQLTILRGYLKLLLKQQHEPVSAGYLEKCSRVTEILEHQINFTRDYQDMGVKAPDWQNVKEMIKKNAAFLPVGEIRITTDIPDFEVLADPLIEKVFYNLIENALKHGGSGLTTIRFSCQKTDQGLVLSCEDDGEGITSGDKEHLFERGFGKNTGLGLFVSREVLAITGITITETGTPGKGARFEITVPTGAYRFFNK